jgi:hypothetical protein
MANITVPQMPTATDVSITDLFHVIQSGVDKNATLEVLANLTSSLANTAGEIKMTGWKTIPAGVRALFLTGQTVLAANYAELVTNTYTGDTDNATAEAYYRCDNADGTGRNIAGIYFKLPDFAGVVPRGYDSLASVDPDGATRKLGDFQADAMQGHLHATTVFTNGTPTGGGSGDYGNPGNPTTDKNTGAPIDDGVNGLPRTATETRMANVSVNYIITY